MGVDEIYEEYLDNQRDVCPLCGEGLIRDEVDIGVGTMHSPPRCDNCGWNDYINLSKLFKE